MRSAVAVLLAGSLAIVKLPSGQVHYVPGVNRVYIIEKGQLVRRDVVAIPADYRP